MAPHPEYPNFDPDACRPVARISASICVLIWIVTVATLTLIEPTKVCSAWILPNKQGGTSAWWLVLMQTAMVFWICINAVFWNWSIARAINGMRKTEQRMKDNKGRFSIYSFAAFDMQQFPTTQVHMSVYVGWAFGCALIAWQCVSLISGR